MVMVQRQQAMSAQRQALSQGNLGTARATGTQKRSSSYNPRGIGSFTSCAMGDEDDSVISSKSLSYSSPTSSSNNKSNRRSSFLPSTNSSSYSPNSFYHQQVKTPRWVLGVLCIFTAFSWIRAVQYRTTSFEIMSAMDAELENFVLKKKQSTKLLQDATDTQNVIAKQQWKLKKTQRLFRHETRMLEELAEMETLRETENIEIPKEALDKFENRRSGNVAKDWIKHRQTAILHKIYNLQAHIQEESRQRVIEKYGRGPYNVIFEVKSREGRKPGKFTVRMAPLTMVPHAVETFLDMVSNKILDNTILYSHQSQSHVVAAAPISYGTFQSKQHEMETMGYTGVSFPEYSKDFPHKKYTLGFAGMSTNFYINSVNNEDHHGPGGQQHHELEGDADPCFGEIIQGHTVLMDMQYNRHKGEAPRGWQDYDMTRVISVKLAPWP